MSFCNYHHQLSTVVRILSLFSWVYALSLLTLDRVSLQLEESFSLVLVALRGLLFGWFLAT